MPNKRRAVTACTALNCNDETSIARRSFVMLLIFMNKCELLISHPHGLWSRGYFCDRVREIGGVVWSTSQLRRVAIRVATLKHLNSVTQLAIVLQALQRRFAIAQWRQLRREWRAPQDSNLRPRP